MGGGGQIPGVVDAGLGAYDALQGLDWEWLVMDGAMPKVPLGGKTACPRLRDREPDAPGNLVLTIAQDGPDIRVPPDVGVGGRLPHLGHRLHGLATCGFRGLIKPPVTGLLCARTEGAR